MMLDVFLATRPADSARLAPASITVTWQGCPAEEVRRYLAGAVRLTEMVVRRLDRLHASSRKSAVWGASVNAQPTLEAKWFGAFSDHKFDKVRRTFHAIRNLLSSPRLKLVCDDLKAGEAFGMAIPILFPQTIWLGRHWRFAYAGKPGHDERLGTFVHEAAHLCGRYSLYEYGPQRSGRAPALLLAANGMRATENADNYGYYALDVVEQTAF
jgi:hypothetical protein